MREILLPWDSQPQESAQPADVAGLKHLWLFSQPGGLVVPSLAGRGIYATFGVGASLPTGNYRGSSMVGNAVYTDDTGTGTTLSRVISLGNSSGSGGPESNEFTIVVRFKTPNVTGTKAIFGAPTGGLEWRLNGANLELLKSGVGSMHMATAGVAAGQWTVVVVSYDGATVKQWKDCRLLGSASSSQTFSAVQYALGARGISTSDIIPNDFWFESCAVFDVAVPDSLALELSSPDNWRALFEPRRIYIPGAAPAGAPSLSAATFASRGSTSVRPRVNVTF